MTGITEVGSRPAGAPIKPNTAKTACSSKLTFESKHEGENGHFWSRVSVLKLDTEPGALSANYELNRLQPLTFACFPHQCRFSNRSGLFRGPKPALFWPKHKRCRLSTTSSAQMLVSAIGGLVRRCILAKREVQEGQERPKEVQGQAKDGKNGQKKVQEQAMNGQ